jgi:hypothetical protein
MGVPAAKLPAPLGATATLPNSPGPRSFGHLFPSGASEARRRRPQPVAAPDLTVLTEGATKCADTLTVDSSERSHEAALEQVYRETRRLRNSLDGGERHDICTHHGVRQLIPQRGPAVRSGPSSCQVRPPPPTQPIWPAAASPLPTRPGAGGRDRTDDLSLTRSRLDGDQAVYQRIRSTNRGGCASISQRESRAMSSATSPKMRLATRYGMSGVAVHEPLRRLSRRAARGTSTERNAGP